jgi:fibronectin type III domain protein
MKQSSRRSFFLVFFLTALAMAAMTFAANRKPAVRRVIANPPTFSPACTVPGVSLITDPAGDTGTGSLGTVPGTPAQDITEILVAEPNQGDGVSRLAFTMRVVDLSTLPVNGIWRIFFTVGSTTYFVGAFNDAVNGMQFNYGTAGTVTTTVGPADSGAISVANKTFTIFISNSKVGSPAAGTTLTGIYGRTQTLLGAAGNGATPTHDLAPNTVPAAGGPPTYTLIGSAACPTPTPTPTPAPTPAQGSNANQPRFFTYLSPPGVGDSAGEPSIGSNWTKEKTFSNSMFTIPNGGSTLYFGGFLPSMLKITFNDCSSPAGALWEAKPLLGANTPRAAGDPILFTDSTLGRTFCGQLEGLTPAGCTIDITDNDGDSFIPSDGVIPSDVDHETIGGGIYHSPLPNPNPVYGHAIYYASQSVGEARAFRSDNGGVLFSEATTPMYAVNDCVGLHGHVKVSPADGTVYVPNVGCGGSVPFHEVGAKQTVLVSEDNGITWTQRPIPDSTTHGSSDLNGTISQTRDPSVAVATDGTVYFAYQGADGHPRVAVSHQKGQIWLPSFDVGAVVANGGPVLNATFCAIVAGDPNRATFAFFGSETGGDNWDCGEGTTCGHGANFTGVWYLYIATTFDGGTSWFTQNVTPGDPVQRGGICQSGTCRNLLDFFDATIDKEGRVLVGYDDGCVSASCIDGGNNDFTAKAVIARQTGGKRMFGAFDPSEPALPGAPAVTGGLNAAKTIATLTWPAPDDSGSAITGYKVYRKDGPGGSYNLIATVPLPYFVNSGLDPSVQYCYRVTAVNNIGEGPYCPDVCPVFVPGPNPCVPPGVLVDNDLNPDGTDNDSGQNTPGDPRVNIQQVFVAEPCFGPGVNKLLFTMFVKPSPTLTSPPPSSQWYIIWQRQSPDTDFDRWYVAMKSDANGALSFEYGKFGVALDATNPNPNANTPVKIGDADFGSYNGATGEIKILLSNNKAENVGAGGSLSKINARTFLAKPDAGTKPQSAASDITGDGNYTLSGNGFCCGAVPLLGVVSRKTHDHNTGTYDILMPQIGNPGTECRRNTGADTSGPNQGHDHQLVFVFANPLSGITAATVTKGTGSVIGGHGAIGADPHEYIVNLTAVGNKQRLTVTLTGITDTAGNSTASLSAVMGVLAGDTNGDRRVNVGDSNQTSSRSGQVTNSTNFPSDVNLDGRVNVGDANFVAAHSGDSLP